MEPSHHVDHDNDEDDDYYQEQMSEYWQTAFHRQSIVLEEGGTAAAAAAAASLVVKEEDDDEENHLPRMTSTSPVLQGDSTDDDDVEIAQEDEEHSTSSGTTSDQANQGHQEASIHEKDGHSQASISGEDHDRSTDDKAFQSPPASRSQSLQTGQKVLASATTMKKEQMIVDDQAVVGGVSKKSITATTRTSQSRPRVSASAAGRLPSKRNLRPPYRQASLHVVKGLPLSGASNNARRQRRHSETSLLQSSSMSSSSLFASPSRITRIDSSSSDIQTEEAAAPRRFSSVEVGRTMMPPLVPFETSSTLSSSIHAQAPSEPGAFRQPGINNHQDSEDSSGSEYDFEASQLYQQMQQQQQHVAAASSPGGQGRRRSSRFSFLRRGTRNSFWRQQSAAALREQAAYDTANGNNGNNTLVQAEMVSVAEGESITYAQQVRKDYARRNLWWCRATVVGAMLVIVVLIVLVIFVIVPQASNRKDTSDDTSNITDPRCSWPLSKQHVGIQCLCTNSTQAIVNQLPDYAMESMEYAFSALQDLGAIDPQLDFATMGECTPEWQALLASGVYFLGQGSAAQVEDVRNGIAVLVEVYAIHSLYFKMGGLDWINQEGWLSPGTFVGDYQGIGVFFLGNATSLDLSGNGLKGSIPSEIQFMRSLRTLDLSDNPELTGSLPLELGSLTNLHALHLGNTGLSGSLPQQVFASLTQLATLDLHNNDLQGSIPSEVFTPALLHLDLSRNRFSSNLPAAALGRAVRLQGLLLQNNQLQGNLDESIGACIELVEINLSVNQFSSTLPRSMGRLRRLAFASFLESGITGSIPESYCDAANNTTNTPRQVVVQCTGPSAIRPDCSCCTTSSTNHVDIICSEDFPPQIVERFLNRNTNKNDPEL